MPMAAPPRPPATQSAPKETREKRSVPNQTTRHPRPAAVTTPATAVVATALERAGMQREVHANPVAHRPGHRERCRPDTGTRGGNVPEQHQDAVHGPADPRQQPIRQILPPARPRRCLGTGPIRQNVPGRRRHGGEENALCEPRTLQRSDVLAEHRSSCGPDQCAICGRFVAKSTYPTASDVGRTPAATTGEVWTSDTSFEVGRHAWQKRHRLRDRTSPHSTAGRALTSCGEPAARPGQNIAPFKPVPSCVSHPLPTAPLAVWGTGAVDEAWKTHSRGALFGVGHADRGGNRRDRTSPHSKPGPSCRCHFGRSVLQPTRKPTPLGSMGRRWRGYPLCPRRRSPANQVAVVKGWITPTTTSADHISPDLSRCRRDRTSPHSIGPGGSPKTLNTVDIYSIQA